MDVINNRNPKNRFNISLKYSFFILAILIIIILAGWGGITFLTKEVSCGDGVCSKSEDIDSCPGDCKVLQREDIEKEFILCKEEAEKLCSAIVNRDASYCNSINFETMMNSCLTKTVFMFDIFENKNKDSCLKVKEMDENECANIIDSIELENMDGCQGDLCKDVFRLYLASSQGDISLCEEIIDENTKNDCKLYLTSNMDYCDYSYCSDNYNIYMREQSDDLSYCDEVINSAGKQACLEYEKA